MSAGESTERSAAPAAQPLSSSVLGIAIIAITGMQLMSTLDGTIVIVALPRMQAELDLSDATKSWVITSRTLYLGGTTGPVKNMDSAQLHALDQGYTYGLLWVAAVAVIVGGAALFIGYTSAQVAHAQEVKDAMDAGEL